MDDGWPRRHDNRYRERPACETRRQQATRHAQERRWAREDDHLGQMLRHWRLASHGQRAEFLATIGWEPTNVLSPDETATLREAEGGLADG